MTATAHSENLRCPLVVDGREICLRFHSKGDCASSCTRSHSPVQGQNREVVLRYIRIFRYAMDQSKKRKFIGGGYCYPAKDTGKGAGGWYQN